MAAGISGHVPRILDEISQMPTAPEERFAGLPGRRRIEPREGRVEQRDSAYPAVGGAVKPHLVAPLRGVGADGEDVRIAGR